MQDDVISKTKRKQAMQALQDLGEELIGLSEEKLVSLPLDEDLRAAVLEGKRLHGREALRRQRQYIGRLMREVDAAPIREAIEALRGESQAAKARLHLTERWRERLLGDPSAFGEFVQRYPGVDAQWLLGLVRNAIEEHAHDRPPKSARALFRLLREVIEQVPASPDTEPDS